MNSENDDHHLMTTFKSIFHNTSVWLFCVACIATSCSEGTEVYNFDVSTMNEANSFEEETGSELKIQDDFKPVQGFFPMDSIYQIQGRRVYLRNTEYFLPLTTKYYKDQNSDSIRYIIYEWNKAVPGTTPKERANILFEESKKFDEYHQKYVSLVKTFKKLYGDPVEGNGRVQKSLHIYPIWKAHIRFKSNKKYIDLDWIWIPSNDARVLKIIAKAYPCN